jgi:NAD(P)-dependent dehydrogenase (short-subunit alcohol dehydrogenase family)
VVLIVGASTGIGREIARFYARAGAATALVARTQANLEETRSLILADVPGAAVLVLPADVKDHNAAAKAVEDTVSQLGKLDILIANAGTLSMVNTRQYFSAPQYVAARRRRLQLLPKKTPWNSGTRLRSTSGVCLTLSSTHESVRRAPPTDKSPSAALPHLRGGHGQIVVSTSGAAQMRLPGASDYCTSKHALGRLVELIVLGVSDFASLRFRLLTDCVEYPDVKVFNIHPGAVKTDLVSMSGVPEKLWDRVFIDPPTLAAAAMLYLTAGNADWLSGRCARAGLLHSLCGLTKGQVHLCQLGPRRDRAGMEG